MKAVAMLRLAMIVLTCVAPGAFAAEFGQYRPDRQFTESVTTSFYLTMRDGVKLAVQVTRPARNGAAVEGKFPVLWDASLALPGPRTAAESAAPFGDWLRFVDHGYVVVTAVRRGNGASFGIRRGYHDREEAYDAYEIVDWIAKQPWSTGMVGMHGCSNTGEAVLHTLSVAPPALRAAWAGCFSWNKYDNFLRGGGIIANWGSGPTRTLEEDMRSRPIDADAGKVLLREAATEHLQNVDLAALLRSVPYRDSFSKLTWSRFAVEGSVATYAAQIRRAGIPLYIQGGWQDDGRRDAFIALANLPNARLIIGDWKHCRFPDFDAISEALRFFDFHLKGIDTGIAKDDPVHYFTRNAPKGREWQAAKQWPLPDLQPRTAYLVASAKGVGRLDAKPARAAQVSFTVDYGTQCKDENLRDVTGLQPCHPQQGSASFAGAPLQADLALTGHPVITLWVSANASDANLFAYLEDVAPDGTVRTLTEGRQKASLRQLHEAPWKMIGLPWHRGYAGDAQPLVAGEAVELQFDLLPVSHIVAKGHRLQVAVSGADYRERGRHQEARAPQITVYTGGAHASSISLPSR